MKCLEEKLEALRALHPSAVAVAFRISQDHGVTIGQLLGRDRHRGPALARARLCYALWTSCDQLTGRTVSYPEIGRALELDHTTIMEAVAKVQRSIDHEP